MDAALKYRLLELDDVRDRCRMLIQLLTKRWEEIAGARSAGGRESGNDVH
jgi:hypothetical protein